MMDPELETKLIRAIESVKDDVGDTKVQRYKFESKHMDFDEYARVITFNDLMYNTKLKIRIE